MAVDVGANVDELWLGYANTCARIGSDVKCWGFGVWGVSGYASTAHLGDNELPSSFGMVDTGLSVTSLSTSTMGRHLCVLSGTDDLRCWGHNNYGQLGYGNTTRVGDDETPASVGNVSYY